MKSTLKNKTQAIIVTLTCLAATPARGMDQCRLKMLNMAAGAGDVEVAQVLVNLGVNVRTADEKRCTPLHCAAENGQVAMAELLLKAGAEPDAAGPYGQTPLYYAAMKGHVALIHILTTAGANPSSRALGEAVIHQKKDTVRALLEAGARPYRDLLQDAILNSDGEMVQLLIEGGAEVDAAGDYGHRPLHNAATWNPQAVRILLAAGADPEAVTNQNETPLQDHYRLLSPVVPRLKAAVRALIEGGACLQPRVDEWSIGPR